MAGVKVSPAVVVSLRAVLCLVMRRAERDGSEIAARIRQVVNLGRSAANKAPYGADICHVCPARLAFVAGLVRLALGAYRPHPGLGLEGLAAIEWAALHRS